MDIVALKAIYGVVSGILLYILTVFLGASAFNGLMDYILVVTYFSLYVGYIPLMNVFKISHRKHLTKGIAVYYSVSFLTWVILYDIAPLG